MIFADTPIDVRLNTVALIAYLNSGYKICFFQVAVKMALEAPRASQVVSQGLITNDVEGQDTVCTQLRLQFKQTTRLPLQLYTLHEYPAQILSKSFPVSRALTMDAIISGSSQVISILSSSSLP